MFLVVHGEVCDPLRRDGCLGAQHQLSEEGLVAGRLIREGLGDLRQQRVDLPLVLQNLTQLESKGLQSEGETG